MPDDEQIIDDKTQQEKFRDIQKTTINFSITKCPAKIHQKFCEFCQQETNDNYAMGIKILLECMEVEAKDQVMFQQYMEVREKVGILNERIEKLEMQGVEQSQNKGPKPFGSGGKKK